MKGVIFAVSLMALAGQAQAGFTATTGLTTVSTPAGIEPGAQVGDVFATTTAGTFTTFVPDTAADPQIGPDLANYRYSLNGSVASVSGALNNIIAYSGTYRIFYDQNLDGIEDVLVSGGTFTLTATFAAGGAVLSGELNQTQGPALPVFADLSYGGSPVLYTGTYVETVPGLQGTIAGTLRQNAVIPAPGAAAALALGGLVAARRRRA